MYDNNDKELNIGDPVIMMDESYSGELGYIKCIRKYTLTVWIKNHRAWAGSPKLVEKISNEAAMLWKLENTK